VALEATLAPLATSAGKAASDPVGDYVAAHGGSRPIRKILVANNGMAATKCIMSMRQWAYTEVGARASPKEEGGESVCVGLGCRVRGLGG
jgi:hypothetical protein